MFKKICVGIFVCILSVCLYQSLSYAGDVADSTDDDLGKIEKELDNRERLTERFKDQYNMIHDDVKDLREAYNDTMTAVENSQRQIVFRAGSAVILSGVAYFSAGSLAPAAWMGWNAVNSAIEDCTLDSSQYLEAMGVAIQALDQAHTNMNAAYYGGTYRDYSGDITKDNFSYDPTLEFSNYTEGYVEEWKSYLDALEKHKIVRATALPVPDVALTRAQVKEVLERNNTTDWHHAGASTLSDKHVLNLKYKISGAKEDFETDYECKGPCDIMFRTPWEALTEHRVKCGTAPPVASVLGMIDFDFLRVPDKNALRDRSVDEGCGLYWYSECPGHPKTVEDGFHAERTCGKNVLRHDSHFKNRVWISKCRLPYRRCMGKTRDHNTKWWGESTHSDSGGGDEALSDTEFAAFAGENWQTDLTVPEDLYGVDWYVAGPGEMGLGTSIEYDDGGSGVRTASMDYTFPSGVTGDYVITAIAYKYSNMSVLCEISYTVSVSSSSTSTVTLSPSDDVYTASAGDSHNAVLSILSKGASIGFYVITPNDAINVVSTFLETWAGDGTASAASIDYTFPSNVSGDYTFYATISYNDGTSHSPHPSYTVAVSTPPPAPTTTVSPANGLYTATDANSHTANFSISEAYSSVKWHVKSPSETGLGSLIETDNGDGSTTTADFTYTFPLNVSGDYVITAKGLTSSGLSFEDSYTVSVTIFIPSFSLSTSTYSPGSGLSVSVSANEPIFGCHLFVRSPGDTSTYGTKIGWFGNSRSTSQSLSYTFPTTAINGQYKITLRVYPWYGNTYGAPKYLHRYVNVSSD